MPAGLADQIMPASLDDDQPSLTTIPKEIREIILQKLFEDELEPRILDGVIKRFPDWPLAILQTCHLLHDEAGRAVRAKLCDCKLRYINGAPLDEADIDAEADDDHHDNKHIRFLRKYGDCFETVERCLTWLHGKFPLHWFPHLKGLKLTSRCHFISPMGLRVGTECVDDKQSLLKARVLRCYGQAYFTPPYYLYVHLEEEWTSFIQNTTIGVDRSYTIHFCEVLYVEGLGTWNFRLNFDTDTLEYQEIDVQNLRLNFETDTLQYQGIDVETIMGIDGWKVLDFADDEDEDVEV